MEGSYDSITFEKSSYDSITFEPDYYLVYNSVDWGPVHKGKRGSLAEILALYDQMVASGKIPPILAKRYTIGIVWPKMFLYRIAAVRSYLDMEKEKEERWKARDLMDKARPPEVLKAEADAREASFIDADTV